MTASGLPFFENFYAGGISSAGKVRGFVDNTLGPVYATTSGFRQPLGGSFLVAGSVEAIFPKLFDSPAARVSAFVDFGNVYNGFDNFDAGELRISTGIALLWRSPMGPIVDQLRLPAAQAGHRPGRALAVHLRRTALTGFPDDGASLRGIRTGATLRA